MSFACQACGASGETEFHLPGCAIPFRDVLMAEIAKQEALIKRMDGDRDNGLMTTIRFERLHLLERLLHFESKPSEVHPRADDQAT